MKKAIFLILINAFTFSVFLAIIIKNKQYDLLELFFMFTSIIGLFVGIERALKFEKQ